MCELQLAKNLYLYNREDEVGHAEYLCQPLVGGWAVFNRNLGRKTVADSFMAIAKILQRDIDYTCICIHGVDVIRTCVEPKG